MLSHKSIAYLSLYRVDAFIITALGYLTVLYIFELSLLENHNLWIMLYISSIAINFIYSYNSVSDYQIDSINKPHRPIPSGKISIENARIYCYFLLMGSIVFPFFLSKDIVVIILLLLFPLIGILYSHTFFLLKKIMLFSTLLTSMMLVLPIVIALLVNNCLQENIIETFKVFIYCLAVIPLKDIEDIKGDIAHQSENWANKFGIKKLIFLSIVFLLTQLVIQILFYQNILIDTLFLILLVCTICYLSIYLLLIKKPTKLYKNLIYINILLGILFILANVFK